MAKSIQGIFETLPKLNSVTSLSESLWRHNKLFASINLYDLKEYL
jgi:hypothetical protein